jgi:succinoglycan biosynthesis transport protein ExoP
MTTLPQTTNVRLPRPAQGGLQLAQQGGGLAIGGGAGAPQQGANEIWRVIRSHLWMIILVAGVIAPVAGYGVNYLLAKKYPRYTAAGYIQVQPQVQPGEMAKGNFAQADPANVALEIRTHAQILKTDSLLTRVLQNTNSDIRKTRWFAQFNGDISKAKQDFEDNLSVTPLQDTKLVKVEFTYSEPVDCKTIVQELVQTHLIEQQQSQKENLLDRTAALNGLKAKYDARLQQLAGEKSVKQVKFQSDAGSGVGISRMSIKDLELSKLVAEQIDAAVKANKALGEQESISTAIRNGEDPAGVEVLVQRLSPYLASDEAQLQQIDVEAKLVKTQFGEDNPKYKSIAQRLELMQTNYQKKLEEARAKARLALLEEAKQEAAGAQAKFDTLRQRVDTLRTELGDLNSAMLDYVQLQEEEKGLKEQVKQVREQIENVMAYTGSQASSRVTWMTPPQIPMNKSFPKLPVTMGLAIALGLALSLGVAFTREAMDQSIRSPRDIARIGQINLLGLIPDKSDDPQSEGARLPVVIFDAPHSAIAESFRHVRTKLQHTASLDTTRSIMVTSPSPGDGKTVIACNIATGLALNGRRILLVDANFRRPEIHKVFGLANEQGFSDVLNAVVSFDEVVQETQVPNLAVMPAGPKPMNPTELFESQLLIDFIERALEEFDHVIFDSGPIMVVAEAQAMAPRVDGVVSVVRAKTNNRGLLQRMRDELRRTKAEHLGVVLNAVRAQGGGYYGANIKTYYDYANSAK